MTETPALGDLIRESRLTLGYSLGQLATKVGRTVATVRSWERGEEVPTEESRAALESVLGIDAGQLEALVPSAEPEPAGGDVSTAEADPDQGAVATNDDEAGDVAEPSTGGAADTEEAEGEQEPDVDAAESASSEGVGESVDDDEHDRHEDGVVAASGIAVAVAVGEEAAYPEGEAATDAAEIAGHAEEDLDQADQPQADAEGGTPSDEEADRSDAVESEGEAAGETPANSIPSQEIEDGDDTLDGVAAVTPFEVDPALIDEPTEAVVIPVVAAATGVATQTRSVVTISEPKERRSRNPLRAFFDPKRRWLYWLRALLTLAVMAVLLVVLVWAAGELFDALGQVLDSIEPTEVDDTGIDALGRFRTLI
jgi:transcriptional regulator with XRE-family HTH domain